MSQSFPFVSRIPGGGDAKAADNQNPGPVHHYSSNSVVKVNGHVNGETNGKPAPDQKKKVIVVGAGIAGLRAAQVLHRHGIDVVVLEGRDRIGGRIWTVRENVDGKASTIRDMGAAWLHETAHNPLTRLIRELDLPYYYDDGAQLYYTKYGKTGAQFKAKKAAEEYADFAESYYKMHPQAKDRSVDSFIRRFVDRHELISQDERLWAPQAVRDVEHMLGMTTMEASAKHLCYFHYPERNLYVKGGYDKIAEWAAKPLRADGNALQLSRVVKHVDWSNGLVNVHFSKADQQEIESISADAVVVTVPLGCLHHKMISFNPPLPNDIEHGISMESYGVLGKVFFEFADVFWSKENDQFVFLPAPAGAEDEDSDISNAPDNILNYGTTTINLALIDSNSKQLCIQIVEPLTQRLEAMSDDWDKIYKFFVPLFRLLRTETSKALPPLVSIAVTNWSQDPLSGFGTFATEKVGDEPGLLLQALEDHRGSHLQFAGDHCADIGCGCVHGAISSGEVAATNLLATFDIPYDGGDLVTLKCEIDSDDEC